MGCTEVKDRANASEVTDVVEGELHCISLSVRGLQASVAVMHATATRTDVINNSFFIINYNSGCYRKVTVFMPITFAKY